MQKQYKYVVEHMEEFLYDWCYHEYLQMLKYLNRKSQLIITNFKQIKDYKGKDIAQNHVNLNKFEGLIQQYQGQVKVLDLGIHEYRTGNQVNVGGKMYPTERICLLDMRGSQVLSPEDTEKFDVFVFGGILGDHPPRDRTKALRKEDIEMRHLGSLQLSTDTAVLVTKLIVEKQIKFEDIKFVDEPEMEGTNEDGIQSSVQMEGFRYVTTDYDVEKEEFQNGNSQEPLMSQFIREKLMFDDFDLGEMILESQ